MDKVVLLPPKPGTCSECAAAHNPEQPHDRDSLYYQMRFHQKHGRFPTWADAMAHCSEDVKALWNDVLIEHDIAPEQLE
ncbi:MAG: hypothetical protein IJ234_01315 [Clostridia bacterium]|nr:hypothetical protein [Clostridia bacterium]